jgi:hypothetical protein
VFFFNNCHNRNYSAIYGIADAFYDLEERQTTKATTFNVGEECIVASKERDQIRLTRFKLARVEIKPDENGKSARVFCGPVLQSDVFSKGDAARDALYSAFFNKKGGFKRQSVLQR